MSDDICGYEPTTTGRPCRNDPVDGSGLCHLHPPDGGQRGHAKLSKDRQERIATAIESGVPLVASCRLNGITLQTHLNWMSQGETQDAGPHQEYFDRLTRALGVDQRDKTATLWETAKETKDTATMLTILKQRYPETWGEQDIGEAMGLSVELHREVVEAAADVDG